MKSNMIKVSYVLAITVVFSTSCEKEDVKINENSGINNSSEQSVKDKKQNNKFGLPGYWDDLQSFIFDVMNDNPLSDMDAEKAFYYTESALDWRLSGREDDLKSRVDGVELIFNVNLQSLGSTDILAADLELLNDNIYNEISTQAATLASTMGETITAESIDLTWELNLGAGTAVVNANVLYGVKGVGANCTVLDAKAGIAQRCSGALYNHAAAEIDKKTAPLCGYWLDRLSCNLSNNMLYNITVTTHTALTPCGSFLYGGSATTCRSAFQNESDFQLAKSHWNTDCGGTTRFDKLRTVRYWAVQAANPVNVNHQVSYHTALCKSTCIICPAIHRPKPQWP